MVLALRTPQQVNESKAERSRFHIQLLATTLSSAPRLKNRLDFCRKGRIAVGAGRWTWPPGETLRARLAMCGSLGRASVNSGAANQRSPNAMPAMKLRRGHSEFQRVNSRHPSQTLVAWRTSDQRNHAARYDPTAFRLK